MNRPAETSVWSRPVVSVVAAAIVYFAVGGLSFPVLPRLVERELGGSRTDIGLAFGAMTVGMLVLRPFIGYLSDRFGRRPLIILGSLSIAVSMLLHVPAADVGGLPLLLVVRFVYGLGASAMYVGLATIATEIGPPERRGQIFSIFSVAVYVGFAIGPVLGETVLESQGFTTVFAVGAGLSILCAAVTTTLPETRPAEVEPRMERVGDLLHPVAARVGTVNLIVFLAFMGFNAFIAPYGESVGASSVRWVLLTFSVVSLVMRMFGGRLLDTGNRVVIGTTSHITIAAGVTILALFPSVGALYVGAVVLALGLSLNVPLLMIIATESTAEVDRSKVVATVVFFGDLANSLGVLFLGIVADLSGYRAMYLTVAIGALLGTVLYNSRFMDPVSGLRRTPPAMP